MGLRVLPDWCLANNAAYLMFQSHYSRYGKFSDQVNWIPAPYKLANILGSAYDYIYPPLSDEHKKAAVNNSLLAFMQQAQGFDKTLFGVKDG